MRSNKVGVKVDYGREGGGDVSRAKKKERSILDDDSDDDGMSGDLTDVGDRYMRDTTLHGLKYITEDRRHSAERIFWFVTCAIAWLFAAYFSYKIMWKWKLSPILVSFESVQTGIYSIPFPSLTICNMNKVRRSRVEHIDEELAKDPESEFYLVEQQFVQEICTKHESIASGKDSHSTNNTSDGDNHNDNGHRRRKRGSSSSSGQDSSGSGDDSSGHIGTNGDLEMTGKMLHHYLADLGIPCEQMLLRCHFEGRFFNCSEIFVPTITDEGQCCSFNIMPESIMFKNQEGGIDEEEEARWIHWTMQDGYDNLPEPEALHDIKDMPLRALSPGLHMGLSVVLDVQEHEYYCTGHESIGFKVLLHTPISQPEMIEYGFAVSPGTEAFLAVTPEMIHAEEAIHTFSYETRGCYLEGEKMLSYFHHYSFLNCFMECSSNFTFSHCGCVAYYMPRNPDEMLICSPEHSHCVDEAVTIVEESAYDDNHEINTECRCLPACTDMEFPHETSVSKIKKADMINLAQSLKDENPDYENDTYVANNIAILNVYFKNLHFMRQERGELFGFVDLFSNIGGLMGLCCGLSALSVVEVIYFFSIRLYFNRAMHRKEVL